MKEESKYPFVSALAYKDPKLHGALKELIDDVNRINSLISTRKHLIDDGVCPAIYEAKKIVRDLIYRIVCSVSVRTMCDMTYEEGRKESALSQRDAMRMPAQPPTPNEATESDDHAGDDWLQG